MAFPCALISSKCRIWELKSSATAEIPPSARSSLDRTGPKLMEQVAMAGHIQTTDRSRCFGRLLRIRKEPSNRTVHKWLLTGVQSDNARSAFVLKTISPPAWPLAFETGSPDTRSRTRRLNSGYEMTKEVILCSDVLDTQHASILNVPR